MQETLKSTFILTIKHDAPVVLNCENLTEGFSCLKARKEAFVIVCEVLGMLVAKFCCQLMQIYLFSLCPVDNIAFALERPLCGKGVKCSIRKVAEYLIVL